MSLTPLANHLWQSTLFAAVAAMLALALRSNRAQTRYAIWLAASIKFLIPFSLLVSAGSRVEWRSAPAPVLTQQAAAPSAGPSILFAVWLCGFTLILARWSARLMRIRTAVRATSPLLIAAPIRITFSPASIEPGAFGVFRPVLLLLPASIANRLTAEQLNAIPAHELCHVPRRDNLFAAIHMAVEASFWFNLLVWWIGARLVEERERACDEEVLRRGSQPQACAEGILRVCTFHLESRPS